MRKPARYLRILNGLATLTAVGTGLTFAGSIQFTTSGPLDPGTPVTTISAPGPFTLTFVTPVNPVTAPPTIGGSSFSVSVPGTLMMGATTVESGPITVDFFAGSDAGFEATVSNGTDNIHLSIDGPQLFSGSLPNVTILPISYTAGGAFLSYYVDSSGNFGFPTAPTVTASTVPEPGTSVGAAGGLLLIAALMLRGRRRTAITAGCPHSS